VTERGIKVLAWGSWLIIVVCAAVSAAFSILAWEAPLPASSFGPKGFSAAVGLVFGTVGALVAARRPSNPIGWILCVGGVISGIQAIGASYALWALVEEGGGPPGGTWGAWLEEWTWIPIVGSLGLVAAIFPDGRTLSRRWRRIVIAGVVGTAVASVLAAIVPELSIYSGYDNPAGVGVDALVEIAGTSIALMMFLIVAGTASAFARFRRSSGDEREQLKWLAVSVTLVVLSLTVFAAYAASSGWSVNPQGVDWSENLVILSLFTVPVAIGIGVLKYRLYDIDVVINKAVVYGALAVFITIVYVAIVAGVGAAFGSQSNALLSAAAAAVVALAFQPARRQAQHLANRFVYGRRATPYEVLSELSSRFAGAYSLEDALPRLARVTAEAVGAERARVWLRTDTRIHAAAGWPADDLSVSRPLVGDELPPFGGREEGFAVRHQGELLGAISVAMPASEPLGPAQDKLLRDVAAQAGLVLRNVALLEDLRASRKRIVTAQDERARALERNIHDGAQQQLVALAVKLRLADSLVGRDDERAHAMLTELQAESNAALENLRDLARGIYPPLLADKGLPAALEAQARKSPVPVEIRSDGVGRYPQDVEAAIYFCALEALQNVAKYAAARRVGIRLASSDGHLRLEVEDDGAGFDAETATGTGLTNMRDRLEALGGRFEVRSAPGRGTTVVGSVPLGGAG
jgi:signal transduction histidine kinase